MDFRRSGTHIKWCRYVRCFYASGKWRWICGRKIRRKNECVLWQYICIERRKVAFFWYSSHLLFTLHDLVGPQNISSEPSLASISTKKTTQERLLDSKARGGQADSGGRAVVRGYSVNRTGQRESSLPRNGETRKARWLAPSLARLVSIVPGWLKNWITHPDRTVGRRFPTRGTQRYSRVKGWGKKRARAKAAGVLYEL